MGYVPAGQKRREFLDDIAYHRREQPPAWTLTLGIMALCVFSFMAGAAIGHCTARDEQAAETNR